jgi:hypothetical protein
MAAFVRRRDGGEIKLNTLPRYSKRSPRFTLEVHAKLSSQALAMAASIPVVVLSITFWQVLGKSGTNVVDALRMPPLFYQSASTRRELRETDCPACFFGRGNRSSYLAPDANGFLNEFSIAACQRIPIVDIW